MSIVLLLNPVLLKRPRLPNTMFSINTINRLCLHHIIPDEKKTMLSANKALERLREGNRRFVSGLRSLETLISQIRRSEFVHHQAPFAVVLGCSDSRVPVSGTLANIPKSMKMVNSLRHQPGSPASRKHEPGSRWSKIRNGKLRFTSRAGHPRSNGPILASLQA